MINSHAFRFFLAVCLFCAPVSAWALEAPDASTEAPAAAPVPREVASDTNHDGKPDRWERYHKGVLVLIEADTDFDGTIDEKGYLESGRLVKVEKDSDGDGKMDRWISY